MRVRPRFVAATRWNRPTFKQASLASVIRDLRAEPGKRVKASSDDEACEKTGEIFVHGLDARRMHN